MDNDRIKNYLLCGAAGLLLAALLFAAFKTGQKYPLKLDSAGINAKVDTLIQKDTIRLEKPVFVTKYVDRVQLVKFYPEGNAETRLNIRGSGFLYIYCNKHGLMKQKI